VELALPPKNPAAAACCVATAVGRANLSVRLFWLTYRPSAAGVIVIEAPDLLQARFKAAVYDMDRGLEFAAGHQLDPLSAEQIPAGMLGRRLSRGDLRKLHQMLAKEKPPAPSVRRHRRAERRWTAAKRRAGEP
jgi:hypothetical protein